MKRKNCIVAQSGGPTVAINASLAGVVEGVLQSQAFETVYGAVHGILGVMEEDLLDLTAKANESEEFLPLLKRTPAMYLGSCRLRLHSYTDDKKEYETIFSVFEKYNIGAFFYIGGNDSMDTVKKLSEYAKEIQSDVKIVGIPKTIDNDLCLTDHAPGYGSAAKYIATSLAEMGHDTSIYPVQSITIVEIMGRDAGWLTASSVLARCSHNQAPHLVYLPEVPFDKDAFIEDVKECLKEHRNVVVAVSEGIRDAEGNYISAAESSHDTFGHEQLSGAGKSLEYLVKERLGIKVRSVEVNILQRCASHILSKTDITESCDLGKAAVQYAEQGSTGIMVALKRAAGENYQVTMEQAPIANVAEKVKGVPVEWITKKGNDMTEEFIAYAKPLIQGEVPMTYENGIPKYLDISHLW